MNVRKRADNNTAAPVRNANTTMKSGPTQAAPIKNAHNKPKAVGFSKVRNASQK